MGTRGRPNNNKSNNASGLLKARPFNKARGRARAKPVTINTKELEKVHRTVAGTDYEFDDDFGESKEPGVTLNDLRAQSKKQTIPIYMQNKNKKQQKDAFDDFGFDEPPEITKPARSAKKGRGG